MKFPVELGHRTTKELITLTMTFTICAVILLVVIVGAFRPPKDPQTGERIYRLLDTMIGVVAGIIGGGVGGYAVGKGSGQQTGQEKSDVPGAR